MWEEILQLPARQRAALLLNLRDAQNRDVIHLLPETGTATEEEIAEALEMPLERFAEMWRKLPLDDASIAAQLGVTRRQVINLRKAARARVWRGA